MSTFLGIGFAILEVLRTRSVDVAKSSRWMTALILLSLIAVSLSFSYSKYTTPAFETKGTTSADTSGWLLIGMYISMLAGIACQYFYFADKKRVNWRQFLKPFFASPILFIPLASAYGTMSPSQSTTLFVLMMLLTSFQNGFFWKTVFDRQERATANETARS